VPVLFSLASSHANDIVPFLIAQSITTGTRPVFCVIELGRADVRGAEIECLRLHQHGVAAAAEVPNLACVETFGEADLVVAHPLGYRCLAAAQAGAGSVRNQTRPKSVRFWHVETHPLW